MGGAGTKLFAKSSKAREGGEGSPPFGGPDRTRGGEAERIKRLKHL